MKFIDDTLHFSSGRTVQVNLGVVGLDLDCLSMCYGCDGMLGEGDPSFTDAEKIEIATFMIRRWTALRDRVVKEATA